MLKTIYATICSAILLFTLTCFLQGCSPVYKTHYIYHPVSSEKAVCANECIKNKQICKSQCLDLQRQCERDANMLGMASGLVRAQTGDLNAPPSARLSLIEECKIHLESCELACDENHKLCHENCGGSVTVQSVCVKNCK